MGVTILLTSQLTMIFNNINCVSPNHLILYTRYTTCSPFASAASSPSGIERVRVASSSSSEYILSTCDCWFSSPDLSCSSRAISIQSSSWCRRCSASLSLGFCSAWFFCIPQKVQCHNDQHRVASALAAIMPCLYNCKRTETELSDLKSWQRQVPFGFGCAREPALASFNADRASL